MLGVFFVSTIPVELAQKASLTSKYKNHLIFFMFIIFSSTWNSFSDFTCHKVKMFLNYPCEDCEPTKLPEDITDCVVLVGPEDSTATCESMFSLNSLVNSCAGKNCCGRRRVWSRYRNKCVRNFVRG